jgi:predicted N-acyltransferase
MMSKGHTLPRAVSPAHDVYRRFFSRSLPPDLCSGIAMNTVAGRMRIAHGVEQVPESEWQDLVVGHPALRLEVLNAITNTAIRPIKLQFFLLEDHLGLAAAAVCEPIAWSAAHNPLDALLLGRAAGPARRLGVSSGPALVFHTPLRRQAPVLLRAAHPSEQRQVLDSLLDAIEEHAARVKYGIAFVGVTLEDNLLWSALRSRRYLDSEFDATACMQIEWADFDGYVDHLRARSKNAAQTARTELSRNRRNGVSIRQLPFAAADAYGLYAIFRNHYRYKNGSDPPYGPEFLTQLAASLGDDLLIFEAVRDGKRVAALAVVCSGSVGWMAMIGLELRDRPNDFTYANLLFYHTAIWAPALSLKTLLYGTGVQRFKQKRGCRLLACHLYYRPGRPIGRVVAMPYLRIHQAWMRGKYR